jgi:serine/threonine protein kinase
METLEKEDENYYINNKYLVVESINSGAFGDVFKGINIITQTEVAIKRENKDLDISLLKNEALVYDFLKGIPGILSIKWYGTDGSYRYLVIGLLGKSLEDLIDLYQNIGKQQVKKLGVAILDVLKNLHNKGLVHRDIKPSNILLGSDEDKNKMFITDFGLSTIYIESDGSHKKERKVDSIIGSRKYISINGHNLISQSRRDDLESFFYVLEYLIRGDLPWDNEADIKRCKELYILSDFVFFKGFINNIRQLGFDEAPNYELLKSIIISS